MKWSHIVLACLGCTSAAVLVAWRHYLVVHAPPPAQVVIVIDASNSMRAGCADTVAAIRGAIQSPGVKPGSTLTIIRTGDISTRLEPQSVFSEVIPAAAGAGPFGGQKKAKRAKAEFLTRAQAACTSISQTNTSPVVKAVRRALAQLNSSDCPREAGCILIVASDLQDTDELAGREGKIRASLLDNAGIDVMLCGFTGTIEDGYTVKTNDLLDTWRELFTAPVRVAPFCSDQMWIKKGGTE